MTFKNADCGVQLVLRALGRSAEAVPAFMKVVAMAPDFVEAHRTKLDHSVFDSTPTNVS